MRIAAFQYDIGNSKAGALDAIAAQVARVAEQRPTLVALPELCLTGYGAGPEAIATTLDSEEVAALKEHAGTLGGTVIAGLCVADGGVHTNRAVTIDGDGVRDTYIKRKLFPVWREPEWFVAGDRNMVFDLDGWEIGVSICYDLRFPELYREAVGTHLFVVIANWPMSRRDHWRTLLKARAIENQAYVVGVNRIGESNQVAFAGDTLCYDYEGKVVFDLEDRPDIGIADLDKEALERFRKRFPFLPR